MYMCAIEIVRQRARGEEQTEKNEKSEKSERMSVREPSKETRHWHRKRTWMPLITGLDQGLKGSSGEGFGVGGMTFPREIFKGWWEILTLRLVRG